MASSPRRPDRLGRTRGWMINAALVVISTVVALVLAELGLRAYFWGQGIGREDFQAMLTRSQQASQEEVEARGVFGVVQPSPYPDVVYEVRPNLRGTFRGEELRTNAFGMRSGDIERRKPPGTVRILGIGDSHMFGWGVAQDEAYLSILERRLNAEGIGKFEVLNLGAPGYNTAIEVAVLEHKGLDFDPDLIVMHFVGNDFELPHLLQPPREAAPRDWYLLDVVRAAIGLAAGEQIELLSHDIRDLPEEEQRRVREEYQHMLGPEGYQRAIDRLAEVTRDPPVPVLVMMLGEGSEQRQRVRQIVDEAGLGFLNPMPHFGAYLDSVTPEGADRPGFRLTFQIPKDGHPNVAAHRAYAEALFAEMMRRYADTADGGSPN